MRRMRRRRCVPGAEEPVSRGRPSPGGRAGRRRRRRPGTGVAAGKTAGRGRCRPLTARASGRRPQLPGFGRPSVGGGLRCPRARHVRSGCWAAPEGARLRRWSRPPARAGQRPGLGAVKQPPRRRSAGESGFSCPGKGDAALVG